MDALAEVDLGQAVHAEVLGQVDEQPELDAVAAGEAELLEDPAVGRRLAGQRLAHPRELGEEELEHGAGHELGDPPATRRIPVERAGVVALDQGHVVGGEQRAQQSGHEGGGRVGHVGIQERDDVPGGGGQRSGHRLALAPGTAGPGHDAGPGAERLRGGVVERAVVEHDHLVHQAVAAVLAEEGLDHGPDDRAHRRALVPGRDADRHRPAGVSLGLQDQASGEVTVVIGVRHASDSSSHSRTWAALRWSGPRGYHGGHHPERLRDGPGDVAATSALAPGANARSMRRTDGRFCHWAALS